MGRAHLAGRRLMLWHCGSGQRQGASQSLSVPSSQTDTGMFTLQVVFRGYRDVGDGSGTVSCTPAMTNDGCYLYYQQRLLAQ